MTDISFGRYLVDMEWMHQEQNKVHNIAIQHYTSWHRLVKIIHEQQTKIERLEKEMAEILSGTSRATQCELKERTKLYAEIEQLRRALPDPRSLEIIAMWFDREQAKSRWPDAGHKVQADLCLWATRIHAVNRKKPEKKVVKPKNKEDHHSRKYGTHQNKESNDWD